MLNSSTLVAVYEYSLRRNRITVLTVTYQGLPDSLHHWRYHQVDLVWFRAALPILTIGGDHTKYPNGLACVDAYQMLPTVTRAGVWLYPAHGSFYQPAASARSHNTQ